MKIEVTGSYCVSNIRYLRQKYVLSYRALGKLIGMDDTILQLILQERRIPVFKRRQLARICAIFEVPLEDLIHKDLSIED